MTLDDIPADQIFTLTLELERLFRFARCVPKCHACDCPIVVGEDFQLISCIWYKGTHFEEAVDEMVCGNCDRAKLEAAKERARQEAAASRGGYSRPSRRAGEPQETGG